ncbi:hypothetical protein, partial [Klebsiella pneumoniae]|uniref:hypothetical protein n=1 Tax=Klebsiella pneumoniae TaxID=573 RepID=UPI001BB0F1E1
TDLLPFALAPRCGGGERASPFFTPVAGLCLSELLGTEIHSNLSGCLICILTILVIIASSFYQSYPQLARLAASLP